MAALTDISASKRQRKSFGRICKRQRQVSSSKIIMAPSSTVNRLCRSSLDSLELLCPHVFPSPPVLSSPMEKEDHLPLRRREEMSLQVAHEWQWPHFMAPTGSVWAWEAFTCTLGKWDKDMYLPVVLDFRGRVLWDQGKNTISFTNLLKSKTIGSRSLTQPCRNQQTVRTHGTIQHLGIWV